MRSKKELLKVKIPILNDEYCTWVVWGDDGLVEKWLRKWFENDPTIDYQAFKHNRGSTYNHHEYNPVIVIKELTTFDSTLAHEAVHAVNRIFNDIGDDSRGELFAHSVGAIVRKVAEYRERIKISNYLKKRR